MIKISEIKNVFVQSIKFQRFSVISDKLRKRVFEKTKTSEKEEIFKWLNDNLSELSLFAKSIDINLWEEANKESILIEAFAKEKLKNISFHLGGGGIYPLLYFLTRYFKPGVVVETGVAAGYSSSSFLKAIDKNKFGRLFSSDFPYVKIENPELYIGIVVENNLKRNWNLYIEGDKKNLQRIVSEIKKEGKEKIDIFHYDSDKSYSGRKMAFQILDKYLRKDTIIIMDDIQDNKFFKDYIYKNNINCWKIFKFQNKYVGLISSKLIT